MGLRARINSLRQTERIILEATGIQKQIAAEQQKQDGLRTDLEAAKAENQRAKENHARLLSAATTGFLAKLGERLPEGEPYLKIEEGGGIEFGWVINKVPRPFRSLSGGERVAFDMALSYALGGSLVVKELAELDKDRLGGVLEKFAGLDAQVICISCHEPQRIPDGFTVIRQLPEFSNR
jgi:hypothetical protein